MTEEKVGQLSYMFYDAVPELQRIRFVERLNTADDSLFDTLIKVRPKKESTTTLLSIFLGAFGADRFYIGDYLLGALKLLATLLLPVGYVIWMLLLVKVENIWCWTKVYFITLIWAGVINIWWLVDIFVCRKRTKMKNYQKLMAILA